MSRFFYLCFHSCSCLFVFERKGHYTQAASRQPSKQTARRGQKRTQTEPKPTKRAAATSREMQGEPSSPSSLSLSRSRSTFSGCESRAAVAKLDARIAAPVQPRQAARHLIWRRLFALRPRARLTPTREFAPAPEVTTAPTRAPERRQTSRGEVSIGAAHSSARLARALVHERPCAESRPAPN